MTDTAAIDQKPLETTFYFQMTPFTVVGNEYSRSNGFRRSFTVTDHCSRGETDRKDRFGGREVHVVFVAPGSSRLAEFGTKHSVPDPCGHLLIRKGVAPVVHDAGPYGTHTDPPMETQPREFQGIAADVEITEYEQDSLTGDDPEEAFPGTFFYSPDSGRFLSLTLRFTLREFGLMVPVLLASQPVLPTVSLSARKAEIAAAREPIDGDVTSYSVSLHAKAP